MTTQAAESHTVAFTDANFESEVLQSDVPVLVDVWAEWCGPCKAQAPTIDEIATEYAGRVKVGSLDAEANTDIPVRFAVHAIPTLLVFKNGEVLRRLVGLTSRQTLQSVLDKALN